MNRYYGWYEGERFCVWDNVIGFYIGSGEKETILMILEIKENEINELEIETDRI